MRQETIDTLTIKEDILLAIDKLDSFGRDPQIYNIQMSMYHQADQDDIRDGIIELMQENLIYLYRSTKIELYDGARELVKNLKKGKFEKRLT